MKYKFFFVSKLLQKRTIIGDTVNTYVRSYFTFPLCFHSFFISFVSPFFSFLDCCCCYCCNHSEWIARLKTDCLDKLEREICNVLTFVHVYLSIPTHKYFLKCVDKFLSSDNFGLSAFALSNYRYAGVRIGIYIFFIFLFFFSSFHSMSSALCLFELLSSSSSSSSSSPLCAPFDHKSKFVGRRLCHHTYLSIHSILINIYVSPIHAQFIICFCRWWEK